ncbi:thioredoxin domain-containing protein [Cyanobium sp. WAJ14-Wanaka]|uniref:thioredoxin domain-containing protein n=1 Tax=Cyanobium sp. WAJ14-Wanaka TaxID=2823725 RepID=UPI0020CF6867|nr:thioredoxin domain-containing protein [Cyanobium sp. WAJ14-Wanaka]MCP9775851.1 thioredoxin family protein [Cyanobium sp. WAJ14-Wanaka]
MIETPDPGPSEQRGLKESLLLLLLAVVLAGAVLWFRGGLHPEAPLERMARQSPDLQVALANGKPSMVEFYADWCEACKSMAPAMETMESQHRGELNVVLLNVDNPRWQPQMDRYGVNGIPQLELFNDQGVDIGRSIGARSGAELQAMAQALIAKEPLPKFAGMGAISTLDAAEQNQAKGVTSPSQAGPRSHG